MLNSIFARLRFGRSHAGVVPALPSMFDNSKSVRRYDTQQMPCDELDDESLNVDKVGCFANGTNTSYMEALYDKWSENPFSVPKSWHIYFEEITGKNERSIIVNNADCIIDFYERWKINPDIVEESWREYFLNGMPTISSNCSLEDKKVPPTEPKTKSIDETNISAEIKGIEEIYCQANKGNNPIATLMETDTILQTCKGPVAQKEKTEESTFLGTVTNDEETLVSFKDSLQINGTLYDYFEALARSDAKWMLKPSTVKDNINYTRSLAIYYLREPVKSNTKVSVKHKSLSWKCKLYTPDNVIGVCPKLEQQESTKEDSDMKHQKFFFWKKGHKAK